MSCSEVQHTSLTFPEDRRRKVCTFITRCVYKKIPFLTFRRPSGPGATCQYWGVGRMWRSSAGISVGTVKYLTGDFLVWSFAACGKKGLNPKRNDGFKSATRLARRSVSRGRISVHVHKGFMSSLFWLFVFLFWCRWVFYLRLLNASVVVSFD